MAPWSVRFGLDGPDSLVHMLGCKMHGAGEGILGHGVQE